jgi:pyruvate dehydrogenase (quinone)
MMEFLMPTAADILIETLIAWEVEVVFGLPGDGINGIMEALRKRQDEIRFVQVRHEESAAFMACAYAKLTGRLGVCLATSGPGGTHLLTGLYDAKLDQMPVLAITGMQYHDLIETFTQQDVDLTRVFDNVAIYNAHVSDAAHMENVASLACRSALAKRGVAHISIASDAQEMEASSRSKRNKPKHVPNRYFAGRQVPDEEELSRAAEILNAASKVAILAGRGALGASEELRRTADLLAAPVAKALLGKAVLADDDAHTTGGIGILGTAPSQQIMEECSVVLIIGSTFPYIEYYPKPEVARGVQIDSDPQRIGLRFPVDAGLVGDARETLRLLNSRLTRKSDRSFLERAQSAMSKWRDKMTMLEDEQSFSSKSTGSGTRIRKPDCLRRGPRYRLRPEHRAGCAAYRSWRGKPVRGFRRACINGNRTSLCDRGWYSRQEPPGVCGGRRRWLGDAARRVFHGGTIWNSPQSCW